MKLLWVPALLLLLPLLLLVQQGPASAAAQRVLLVVSHDAGVAEGVRGVLAAAGVRFQPSVSSVASLLETVRGRQQDATVQHSGVLAWTFNGPLQELQEAVQELEAVHIVHAVKDIRSELLQLQQEPDALQQQALAWAQWHGELKTWATTAGLGLQRQYFIARAEDLCSATHAAAAVTALLSSLNLAGSHAAVQDAVAAAAAQDCSTRDWEADLPSAGAQVQAGLQEADAAIRDALLAFGYTPLTGLGLPPWLKAQDALADIRHIAQAWAAHAPTLSTSPNSSWSVAAPGPTTHTPAPAVVTFVSDGYEAILNNWLRWVAASGADVARVVVVASPQGAARVRERVVFRDKVQVVGLEPLQPPEEPLPGSNPGGQGWDNTALGDTLKRRARARVWLQRVRVMYEFVAAGVPVIMSDLDAIWLGNAEQDLLSKPQGLDRGFDLLMSPGSFPFELHAQMGVVGCMGFLFANATAGSRQLLGTMLRQKLHQLEQQEVTKEQPTVTKERQEVINNRQQATNEQQGVAKQQQELRKEQQTVTKEPPPGLYYNDQRVLNEQLLRSNIVLNNSVQLPTEGPQLQLPTTGPQLQAPGLQQPPSQGPQQHQDPPSSGAILGMQQSTSPDALRVLYLSDRQYVRVCEPGSGYTGAVVVHCQAFNSGQAKRAFLQKAGLWFDAPGRVRGGTTTAAAAAATTEQQV